MTESELVLRIAMTISVAKTDYQGPDGAWTKNPQRAIADALKELAEQLRYEEDNR